MPRMPYLVRQCKRSRKSKALGEPDVVNREDYEAMELDSRLESIRSLIPLGLMAIYGRAPEAERSTAQGRTGVSPRRRPSRTLMVPLPALCAGLFYTGYGVKTLPGVREAIEKGDPNETRLMQNALSEALMRVRDVLVEAITVASAIRRAPPLAEPDENT